MTPEEREQMESLCKRIEVEKDPVTFDRLVKELNDLLEAKHTSASIPSGRPHRTNPATPT
jgi:hypothetical protein